MLSLKELISEEQDPNVIEKILPKVKEFCTSTEEIKYIAIQKKTIGINFSPDCVVLTDRRIILIRPKTFGWSLDFRDYAWIDVADVHLREGIFGAEITVRTTRGQTDSMSDIPKAQGRRLYRFAQEMEERKRDERRQRDLEDRRASAGGGILINTPSPSLPTVPLPSNVDDPIEKLSQLKAMLDRGLITEVEYEKKKEDILSKM
ncbi:PH domain-containing protein [Sphingobacterium oryzagri]|uniref:PH domain-containing protein n=1 Tax=Sphingobacterium oryzagri TaxID=3025669 RepID=A0ABY7WHC5_9SPHI|nr:PH domain-containing protein [Sphingobacterium sp. KACC 22765]WDF67675.1 PH domain-containing protein [Sphingobacterium sp. KACC 22765]